MMDLAEITGMAIKVEQDETGGYALLEDRDKTNEKSGSKIARDYLRDAMNGNKVNLIEPTMAAIIAGKGTGTIPRLGIITMYYDQIETRISQFEDLGLGNLTYGYGMIFLHELTHSNATGNPLQDPTRANSKAAMEKGRYLEGGTVA